MKRTAALVLTMALLCATAVTAFAESTITGKGNSDSAEVKGTYVAGGTSDTVYSIDVAWGSMEFTYTDASEGKWNPETHDYDNAVPAAWSCKKGDNEIVVTNHSNTGVTVLFGYTPAEGYAITGSFSGDAKLTLDSAVDTAYAEAPTGKAALTLSGALSSDKTAPTKIGTVTVTLANE